MNVHKPIPEVRNAKSELLSFNCKNGIYNMFICVLFFFFFTEFQEELQLIHQSTFVFESQLPNVLCTETGAIIFLHSSSSPNLSLS